MLEGLHLGVQGEYPIDDRLEATAVNRPAHLFLVLSASNQNPLQSELLQPYENGITSRGSDHVSGTSGSCHVETGAMAE